MANKKFKFVLTGALFIAVCLQIGLLLSGFYGISADESGRTLDAYLWITHGTQQSDVWLPFHRVLVGSMLLLWNDLFVVPRIISFFLGLVALGVLVWFSFELFHDRRVTAVTALLAAIFPHRVILSVVPLSEIEFVVLILAGMATYVRWLYNRKTIDLLLTAVLLGTSTSCRYEGWVFAFLFAGSLFFVQTDKTRLLHIPLLAVSMLIVAIFPVYWIITSYFKTNTIFAFATATITRYTRSTEQSFIKLVWRNPASQFVYQNLMTLNFIGIIALAKLSYRQKKIRQFFLLFISILAFLSFLGLFGKALPTHNPWRIPIALSCMIIPFTAYWIVHSLKNFSRSARLLRYGIPAIILLASIVQLSVMTRKPSFTRYEYEAGRFLQSKLIGLHSDSSKVLIETCDWPYIDIILASNLPDRFLYNTGFEPHFPTPPLMNSYGFVNGKHPYNAGIRFFAFKSKIPSILLSTKSVQEIGRYGPWVLYEVVKPS